MYGTRKIKSALRRRKKLIIASRRRIGRIMKKHSLTSKYVLRRKKRKKNREVNEENKPNVVNQEFNGREPLEVVVSDLTYVKVGGVWHYVCLIIDLHAREIIGYAAGREKNAKLVRNAFYRTNVDLRKISIFHTDRGTEFKNEVVDGIITAFGMTRSLSAKGNPHDNAVVESMMNILKTEMVFGTTIENLEELELELFEFVNWYNNRRLHGTLGYIPPSEYRKRTQTD